MRVTVAAPAVLAMLALGLPARAAAPCQNYPASVARALKPRIEALRLIEREAADRLKGLDTRPFSYLVAQANSAAGQIGEARALEQEDGLDRCPEAVPHVRRVCMSAALALADLLAQQATGIVSPISRQTYAQAIAICESLIGLPALQTLWRISD